MQEPRANSTLELVVNEQQLQNMSQIDLSRPGDGSSRSEQQAHQQQQPEQHFSLKQLKEWPARFRESFRAKMDEAKSKSDTNCELVFEVLQAFSGIFIWVVCFICTIILPVILFFIGLFNLDNCQQRPSLPYLVFAVGFVMTASNLFNLALALDFPILTNHQILTSDCKNTIASIINIMFNCVAAFLYILCGYMVFTMGSVRRRLNSPPPDQAPPNEPSVMDETIDGGDTIDCNGLLYYFTFWFETLTLGLVVVLVLAASAFYAYNKYRLAIIRGSTQRSQETDNTMTANPAVPTGAYMTNRL